MTPQNIRKSLGLVILTLIVSHLHAQIDTTALSDQIVRSKDKLGKEVVFALYKDGKLQYKKELGGINLKTVLPIGATSQWLTTALVMTYVQEGKISLDDKVSTYLPIFTKYYKGYITIRHCLTNFTGIRSEEGFTKFLQKNKFASLEAEVNELAGKRDIQTNAGTEFKYSNEGFDIAARVLEVITKKSFDRLMTDKLLRPLAMKNTTFTNENYNDAVNPSTGAKSTATDMINFLSMFLNNGIFNNKQILTEASIKEMQTLVAPPEQIKSTPKAAERAGYSIGEWVFEITPDGKAASVAVPSLNGIWPMIDFCRKYAFVVFTGSYPGEQKKQPFLDIKDTIDEAVGGGCN